MDIQNEDTMVRQIEKNLSNNINENLFLTGRVFDKGKLPAVVRAAEEKPGDKKSSMASEQEYPLVSNDYISDSQITVSRAEYIRQAREACLRQLSDSQVYCRPYDANYMETDTQGPDQNQRKSRMLGLFNAYDNAAAHEENSPQELAAYHSLIIRMACAIVLFLFIFIIDKFDIEIGNLTPDMIQEYVTANDTFQALEDKLVTWLK